MTVAQVAIGLLRQQLNPGDQVHGIVTSGGAAANIIPAHVTARYMCRSVDAERLGDAPRPPGRVLPRRRACHRSAHSTIEEVGLPYSHMVSDVPLLARYREHAESLGRRFETTTKAGSLPTISTDMANVSLSIPTIHPMIGIESLGAVNHQPSFAAACATPSADRAVLDGALALALTGIDVATDASLRATLGASLTGSQAPAR